MKTTMKMKTHKSMGFSLIVGAVLLAGGITAARATTITSVGTEIGGGGTGYVVENWSNPGVPKTYAVGGSNKYGTAGYYQIRPTDGSATIYEAATAANDLGITAANFPTLYATPSFLSGNPVGFEGNFVNFGGYSIYQAPDSSHLVVQGALSVPIAVTNWIDPAGFGNWGNVVHFTLGASAHFRIGFAVDSVGDGGFAPNYISVYNPATGTVFSGALTPDGTPDMAFFDITGNPGDYFDVALWQNAGTGNGVAALSLITFDALPVSTTNVVTSSLNPAIPGDAVTFTSTITNILVSGNPTNGIVTFKDNGTILGTGSINSSGVATFVTNGLAAGSHPITAEYTGDGVNFVGSTNTPALAQVIWGKPSFVGGPSLVAGSFLLTFTGTTGQPYEVLSTTNLAAGPWITNSSGTFVGGNVTYTNTSPTGNQFYRIQTP
jgi:hypothetical protein